jgi:hypothetical protein
MSAMRYRKKPVVVEAMQFTGLGGVASDIIRWIDDNTLDRGAEVAYLAPSSQIIAICTLEGVMHANVGDWIIKGVQGEFYPCKPDIFDATYEVAP